MGGARTDLSGLTAAEARTLFLIAGPSSAVTPAAKAALRKLVQALPAAFRADAERAASAIVLDPAGWGGAAPATPPHLEQLQTAVVEGVQVRLGYRDREGTITERTVHPLGLVSKGTTWYLVAKTDAGLRTFRVWRVQTVELLDEPVVAPPSFDLATTWEGVVADMESRRGAKRIRAIADPGAIARLRSHFGAARLKVGQSNDEGRIAVEISFPEEHEPAPELAGYGTVLEVLEPVEVREELAHIGSRLCEQYRTTTSS